MIFIKNFVSINWILISYFNSLNGRVWTAVDSNESWQQYASRHEGPTVNTTSGVVKGNSLLVLNRTVQEFLGIPYAEPPLGNRRFAKPIPISKPIEGIIDGTEYKASCLQPFNPIYTVTGQFSEDCLFLNVWSPKREKRTGLMPVMFWIHGGAFCFGSSSQKWYNGSILATEEVVLVTINYRVGWFGFLYGGDESAPGNVGLFDQTLGLQWDRVTIFGQSSGSWAVSAHVLSPISTGLFKRAILKSGAHLYNRDRPPVIREEGLIAAKQLGERLGCIGPHWLQCLRDLDANQLEIWKIQLFFPIDGTEFLPLTAREAFTRGKFNADIDLLAGVVKDDGSLATYLVNMLYVIKSGFDLGDFKAFLKMGDNIFHGLDFEKLTKFYLDNIDTNNRTAIKLKTWECVAHMGLVCPSYFFAKLYSQYSPKERNVYFYELTHTAYKYKYVLDFGVHHGSDLELVFGHPLLFPNSTTADDLEFSKEVMKLFVDFAKTGKPDKEWPKLVGTDALPAMEFIKNLHPKEKSKYNSDFFKESCNGVWKGYF